jgi:hypothetical protein
LSPDGRVVILLNEGISLSTARTTDTVAPPMLDDVGATLLQVAGIDAEKYGYFGRSIGSLRA